MSLSSKGSRASQPVHESRPAPSTGRSRNATHGLPPSRLIGSIASREQPSWRDASFLFLFFWLLYAATGSGDLMADSQVRWDVAEQILDTGWTAIKPTTTTLTAHGLDGRPYTIWSPGQSLVLVPFVLAGRLLARLPLPLPGTPEMLGQFLASVLLFPALGAGCLVVIYRIAMTVTAEERAARFVSFAVGLGSMHWHHSVSTGDETQVALCILLCVLAVQFAAGNFRVRPRWLACLAAGLGIWFRVTSMALTAVVLTTGLVFDLVQAGERGRVHKALRGWIIAACLGLARISHQAIESQWIGLS